MNAVCYAVHLNREKLAHYLKKAGVADDWELIAKTFGGGTDHIMPSAEELLNFADTVYFCADLDFIKRIAEDYGDADPDVVVGHIADEILDNCGRVVLEF